MAIWPFIQKKSVVRPVSDASREEIKSMTFLSPKEVQSLGGLPNEAIAGFIHGEEAPSQTFRPNPRFTEFLHEVIRWTAPSDPDFRSTAREQVNGWVYIIDLRTPEGPQGRVPPEDIIGGFQVQDGEIIPGSYVVNDRYCAFWAGRLVTLPPTLRAAFIARLPKVV